MLADSSSVKQGKKLSTSLYFAIVNLMKVPKTFSFWAAGGVIFLFFLLLALLDNQPVPSPNPDIVSPETTTLPIQDGQTPSTFEVQTEQFRVSRVIDGDTIEIEGGVSVRYIGIDTPETVHPSRGEECYGREATQANQTLVLGKTVRLEKDISETDRFGRLLRYVFVAAPGGGEIFVNRTLVEQGFAHAASFPPDISRQEELRLAEREARQKGLGLWGEVCQNWQPSTTLGSETGCVIKGNISQATREKIYHLPGCGSYEKTVINETTGEHWFCSEAEAQAAGWRKAKNC